MTRSPGATFDVGNMLAILAARAGATRINNAATNTALHHELGMRLDQVALQDFIISSEEDQEGGARASAFISALLQMVGNSRLTRRAAECTVSRVNVGFVL